MAAHVAQGPCFASDNYAGVHPAVMEALAKANVGPAKAYGADALTRAARERIRQELGENAEPYFVFLGTAANVLGASTRRRCGSGPTPPAQTKEPASCTAGSMNTTSIEITAPYKT